MFLDIFYECFFKKKHLNTCSDAIWKKNRKWNLFNIVRISHRLNGEQMEPFGEVKILSPFAFSKLTKHQRRNWAKCLCSFPCNTSEWGQKLKSNDKNTIKSNDFCAIHCQFCSLTACMPILDFRSLLTMFFQYSFLQVQMIWISCYSHNFCICSILIYRQLHNWCLLCRKTCKMCQELKNK